MRLQAKARTSPGPSEVWRVWLVSERKPSINESTGERAQLNKDPKHQRSKKAVQSPGVDQWPQTPGPWTGIQEGALVSTVRGTVDTRAQSKEKKNPLTFFLFLFTI